MQVFGIFYIKATVVFMNMMHINTSFAHCTNLLASLLCLHCSSIPLF